MSSSRRFDAIQQLQVERAQSEADGQALSEVLDSLDKCRSADELVRVSLQVVREKFGWAYASAWELDPNAGTLHFAAESGQASAQFTSHSRTTHFARGQGLPGLAWDRGEMVVLPNFDDSSAGLDLSAPLQAGLHSGLAFPLRRDGRVTGAMQVLDTSVGTPSAQRLTVLRAVGTLISQQFGRLQEIASQHEHERDITAMTDVVRKVADAPDPGTALQVTLDSIRDSFGWDYASYWKLDRDRDALVFAQESGSAGAAFEQITRTTSYVKGVGVAGRTWQSGEMLVIPDLGEVSDCDRAPAARDAGIKSGVCLPIYVNHDIVGTIDFFSKQVTELSDSRRVALENTVFMVGQSLERFSASMHLDSIAQKLFDSIRDVKSNVDSASTVAARGRELSESTNARVAALSQASSEISAVVQMIQKIAAQTNLLALNATIEAARAGDAGKGFAVVANEVKELASGTANATRQVEEKVTAIGNEVAGITEALEAISMAVGEINDSQQTISGVVEDQVITVRSVIDTGVAAA